MQERRQRTTQENFYFYSLFAYYKVIGNKLEDYLEQLLLRVCVYACVCVCSFILTFTVNNVIFVDALIY